MQLKYGKFAFQTEYCLFCDNFCIVFLGYYVNVKFFFTHVSWYMIWLRKCDESGTDQLKLIIKTDDEGK